MPKLQLKVQQQNQPSELNRAELSNTVQSEGDVWDDHLYGPFCEMHLGQIVLFGHFICSQNSFGRVCAACSAWPTCPAARQGFERSRKAPAKAKTLAPSRAEQLGSAWEAVGWKAGTGCSTCHVSRSSGDFLREEDTAFGLIYISAASATAA